MSWTVTWSPVCDVDVRHMNYRAAERVCAAVLDWAQDGFAEDLDPVHHDEQEPPTLFRLRVRGGLALVRLDESAKALIVLRILPSPPTRRIVPLL